MKYSTLRRISKTRPLPVRRSEEEQEGISKEDVCNEKEEDKEEENRKWDEGQRMQKWPV